MGTYRASLPGDRRGWRSRGHRIHSSGDYKNPPPADEHDGLLQYNRARSDEAIIIPPRCRAVIGGCIVDHLTAESYRVLAVSVSRTHAHILAELPDLRKPCELKAQLLAHKLYTLLTFFVSSRLRGE